MYDKIKKIIDDEVGDIATIAEEGREVKKKLIRLLVTRELGGNAYSDYDREPTKEFTERAEVLNGAPIVKLFDMFVCREEKRIKDELKGNYRAASLYSDGYK